MFGPNYTEEIVDEILAVDGYPDFRYQLEGVPHGAVHSAIGGDMMPATSPNGKQSRPEDDRGKPADIG